MELCVVTHPLVDHKLTLLRNKNTEQPVFRRLVEELVTLLAYEATRGVRITETHIETPVTAATGVKLAQPAPLVVRPDAAPRLTERRNHRGQTAGGDDDRDPRRRPFRLDASHESIDRVGGAEHHTRPDALLRATTDHPRRGH